MIQFDFKTKKLKAKHLAKGKNKTLKFRKDFVDGFAWFCSKEIMSDRSEVILTNGKKGETWIFAKAKDENDKPKGI